MLNPATGEYGRNAVVTARNGALIAITDENCACTLANVPRARSQGEAKGVGFISV